MKMHKDTRTHEVSFEQTSEGLINGKELIEKFVALAMTIKPNEKKTISTKTLKIVLRAKKNYTAKSFLEEHQEFFDSILKEIGVKEN